MKVLVGCEFSGVVRDAFRLRGHDAWSSDVIDSISSNEFHLKGDLLSKETLGHRQWDLIIAFPPCTYLCSSGSRWHKIRQAEQYLAKKFFLAILNLDYPRVAIENPVGIMSRYAKPDQIIQPWMFGHGETKSTCLWLKGLRPLVPENVVDGRESRIHRLSPSVDRSMIRSLTYTGIAKAMANQWGD